MTWIWAILTLLACFLWTIKSGIMRSCGLSWTAAIAIVFISIVAESSAWQAQQIASRIDAAFWKVWFLGTSSLAIFGALVSFIWFRESISPLGWLGIALAVCGAIILIFK